MLMYVGYLLKYYFNRMYMRNKFNVKDYNSQFKLGFLMCTKSFCS